MVQSLAPSQMRAFAAALLLFVVNLIGLGIGPFAVGFISDALSAQYRADSLRFGLLIVLPFLLWAAVHFEAAARCIESALPVAPAPVVARPTTTPTAS